MKKLAVIAALLAPALGFASLSAEAGIITPSIGATVQSAALDNKAVEPIRWRRHHHHRRVIFYVQRGRRW